MGPVGNTNYTVTPLEDGYTVTTGKGVSMRARNPRWEWAEGNRGAVGSVAGAGLIDGAFQVISDILFSRECLSPNQIFWRASVAIVFGLIAGTAGLVAGFVAAAGFGITGLALTAISFTASLVTTIGLYGAKQNRLKQVTVWAN